MPIVFRGPAGRRTSSPRSTRSRWSRTSPRARPQGRAAVDAADAKGLLKSAIRDDNPVIFIEGETLYNVKGEVPEDRVRHPARQGRRQARGHRRHGHRLHGHDVPSRWRPPRSSPRRASPSRSSTRARSARWTPRPSSRRCEDPPGLSCVEAGAGFAGMGRRSPLHHRAGVRRPRRAGRARHRRDVPMPYARNLERLKTPSKERIIRGPQRLYRTGELSPWPSPRS